MAAREFLRRCIISLTNNHHQYNEFFHSFWCNHFYFLSTWFFFSIILTDKILLIIHCLDNRSKLQSLQKKANLFGQSFTFRIDAERLESFSNLVSNFLIIAVNVAILWHYSSFQVQLPFYFLRVLLSMANLLIPIFSLIFNISPTLVTYYIDKFFLVQ